MRCHSFLIYLAVEDIFKYGSIKQMVLHIQSKNRLTALINVTVVIICPAGIYLLKVINRNART